MASGRLVPISISKTASAPDPLIPSAAMPTEVKSSASRLSSTARSTNSRIHCGDSFMVIDQRLLEEKKCWRDPRDPQLNCSKNLTSPWKNACRSSNPYFSSAMRSAPMPKANPEIFFGSYQLSFTNTNTLGSTIPQPRISSHPVCLQGRHGFGPRRPLPPQMKHETNISALGSVNGKNDGRKLVFTLEPKNSFMA